MRFAIRIIKRFPYLHKMDNLVIDNKLRNVAYCTHNEELVPILSTLHGGSQKFSLINDDFEKFNNIIKNREARNETQLGTEKNKLEIENLNVKLDLLQKDTRSLLNEMNANILKIFAKIDGH